MREDTAVTSSIAALSVGKRDAITGGLVGLEGRVSQVGLFPPDRSRYPTYPTYADQLANSPTSPQIGDDLILTDVISFEVKVLYSVPRFAGPLVTR